MKTNNLNNTLNIIADDRLINLIQDNTVGSTYILLIQISSYYRVRVGKLGWIDLVQGYYIYIGSARRSIKHRLLRHISVNKKIFWHIDYLLSNPNKVEIINIFINKAPCECIICQTLLKNGIGNVIKKGFGSADCRCPSHLLKVKESELKLFYKLSKEMNFFPLLQ